MRIASVAEIKARLSLYLKETAAGPVVVTRNGKAVAVPPALAFDAGFTAAYVGGAPKKDVANAQQLKAAAEACLAQQQDAGTCFSVGYVYGAQAVNMAAAPPPILLASAGPIARLWFGGMTLLLNGPGMTSPTSLRTSARIIAPPPIRTASIPSPATIRLCCSPTAKAGSSLPPVCRKVSCLPTTSHSNRPSRIFSIGSNATPFVSSTNAPTTRLPVPTTTRASLTSSPPTA